MCSHRQDLSFMREFSWRQFREPRTQSHTSQWARSSGEVRLTGENAQVETSLGYMGLHSLATPGGKPSAPKKGAVPILWRRSFLTKEGACSFTAKMSCGSFLELTQTYQAGLLPKYQEQGRRNWACWATRFFCFMLQDFSRSKTERWFFPSS